MKRILIITLLVIGGLLWLQTVRLRGERAERRRVQSNNEVLTDSVEFYRTESGKHAAADSVGEIWCRGAKGCRFGKGRPRSGILRTAESPRSEDFQMGGSACERRRHNPDRFGELPRYKHRHPPANRTPGSAAIPIYPLGHESNPAGGRVVEPAHTDRLY